MLALVVLEAVAIALLAVLVAGLLRSHAEILKQLHDLDPSRAHASAGVPAPRPTAVDSPAVDAVTGVTVTGEAARVALDRPGSEMLLLFLSSGCGTCAPWWDGLRSGAWRRELPGAGVTVVARDAAEESPSLLAGLAGPDVTVLLSSAAWDGFGVPGSPYAVLVAEGRVTGQGVAHSWSQLASLVGQQRSDLDVDSRLLAAGIHPGHPSLHPAPGAWTRDRP